MPEPLLGEIRIVGFNVLPPGWAYCDGQVLLINQNQSLFTILGSTYGGDGRTTFALPDLRGRTPIHVGQSVGADHILGERGGEPAHTLTPTEMPAHTHVLNGTSDLATSADPENKVLARGGSNFYGQFGTPTAMGVGSVKNAGANQGHENMTPFLTLNFIIALQGVFPTRN